MHAKAAKQATGARPGRRLWSIAGLFVLILSSLLLTILQSRQAGSGVWDLKAEVKALRRLAAWGEWSALADRLDRSQVLVPAGEFTLGSAAGRHDERPARRIYLDAFQIDRFEVTNAQFWRYLQASGARSPRGWREGRFPAGLADHPVVGVSWLEAQAYCTWAGKRLPTEAEWEKACRGTDGALYPWGSGWDPGRANLGLEHAENWPDSVESGWQLIQTAGENPRLPAPQPVGSFPGGLSPYGVADMVGNVSEWVADWYNWAGYGEWPARNPSGSGPPWNHAVRGSSWFDRRGQAGQVMTLSRCAQRNSSHSAGDSRLGFRCARPAS